jgi:diguanylate cyclase (GGDEF)-like protein
MELREYIRIILKSWWIILPITLLSLSVALFFSYQQTPIYQAESKYITVLSSNLSATSGNYDPFLYGMDTMLGNPRLYVGFCETMTSGITLNRAWQLVGIDPANPIYETSIYTRTCAVQPESNVILVTTTGPSQMLVSDLNSAIGLAGMEETNQNFAAFPLEILDNVYLYPDPISPNHPRDAILGGAIGLVISVTLALVMDHLRSPLERLEALSIRDPLLNVFNDRYFQQRLTEEVNRARIRYRPLSMARLVPNEDFALLPEAVQDALMRSAALYMQNMLREGDLLAYNRKQDIFEVLLPETPNHEAKELVTKLHTEVRNQTFRIDQYVSNFSMSSGVVEGSGETLELQTMLQQAAKALEKARQNGENTIVFMRGAPSPFVLEDTGMDSAPSSGSSMDEYMEVPVPLPSSAAVPAIGSSNGDSAREARARAAANSASPNSAFVGWDDNDNSSAEQDYVSAWLGSNSPTDDNGLDLNSMIADVRPMDDLETEPEKPERDSRNDG